MAFLALALYLIPILTGFAEYEEIKEEVLNRMRGTENWYPTLAPSICVLLIIAWPIVWTADLLFKDGE